MAEEKGTAREPGARATGDLLERHLVELWRQQRLPAAGLRSEDGEELRIIYPGRPGDGVGPDFIGAVIECGHRRLTADVELHVRSTQWRQHGHQRDPAYNNVGLHVVLEADSVEPTRRQDGRLVSVLAVARYLRTVPRRLSARPVGSCPGARRSPRAIGRRLDRAGDDRFRMKSSCFANELAHTAPGQVLFEGIMEALGYTRNKAPFRVLAQRLPLAALTGEPLETAQARLSGPPGCSRPNGRRLLCPRIATPSVLRRSGGQCPASSRCRRAAGSSCA